MDWRNFWQRITRGQLRSDSSRDRAQGVGRPDPRRVEEWEARIEAAGLSTDWARRLAPGLAASQRELGRGAGPALIRGAVIAMAAQAETQAQVERSLRDVREVERLLGAFSGELEKLDEVLEVLSAYAQRMRPRTPGHPNRRLLH